MRVLFVITLILFSCSCVRDECVCVNSSNVLFQSETSFPVQVTITQDDERFRWVKIKNNLPYTIYVNHYPRIVANEISGNTREILMTGNKVTHPFDLVPVAKRSIAKFRFGHYIDRNKNILYPFSIYSEFEVRNAEMIGQIFRDIKGSGKIDVALRGIDKWKMN